MNRTMPGGRSDDWALTEGWDSIERFKFYTSFFARWRINRERRARGRPPFRWFHAD